MSATTTSVMDRIQAEVEGHPIVLFMKGTPRFPMCGFSSRTVQVRPGASARRLRVRIQAPPLRTSPAARLVVFARDGSVTRHKIALSHAGDGTLTIGFDQDHVARVNLVLVNASTRMTCWHQRNAACQGLALDDGGRFRFTAAALR